MNISTTLVYEIDPSNRFEVGASFVIADFPNLARQWLNCFLIKLKTFYEYVDYGK